VQRSPPLRRGTRSKVAGKEQQDGYADMKADPGMVLNYKAAEEVQPQPAAPQPDLLDFDGLSMDAPPAANAQVSPCMCASPILYQSISHKSNTDRPAGFSQHGCSSCCQCTGEPLYSFHFVPYSLGRGASCDS